VSTTIPTTFVGEPTLTPEKVAILVDWYQTNLWDADKADDVEALADYTVAYEVMEGVLRLLHDMPLEDPPPDEAPVLEMIERLKEDGTISKDAVLVRSEDIPWPPQTEKEKS
jgi:hypothetical protein